MQSSVVDIETQDTQQGRLSRRMSSVTKQRLERSKSISIDLEEEIKRSKSNALVRRLRRTAWLLVYLLSKLGVSAVALFSKYFFPLRVTMRKYLMMPLNEVRAFALTHARNVPRPKVKMISKMDVTTTLKDGKKLHATMYMPVPPKLDSPGLEPDLDGQKFSTIICRTPYGRDNLGPEWAQVFAERGFAAMIQDTRGRFGSDGDFFPVAHERNDGGETIEWVLKQPWSNGKVALFGVSYLGLTAYAAAGSDAGKHVAAIVPVMAAAQSYSILYHPASGSLALDLVLRWLWLAVKLMNTPRIVQFWFPPLQGELNNAFMDAPLASLDEKLIGSKLDFLQQAIRATEKTHEFWEDKNVLCDLSSPDRPPAHIVGGWYDFFVKQSFADFEAGSRKAQNVCKMTIGIWKHWEVLKYGNPALKIGLDWFTHHMEGEEQEHIDDDHSVHVAFLGTNPTRWVHFDEWPPKDSIISAWPLSRMTPLKAPNSRDGSFSVHFYDPNDPTPYAGGPSFDPLNSGRQEQSWLENRDDVLVWSSKPLSESLYICGDVFVELHARSTNPCTDFFFKLCEVVPDDGSYNIVEELVRLTAKDWDHETKEDDGRTWFEIIKAFKIGPIAQRFALGNSVRLQISGGAHPLYMRNFGTDHHIADAVETLGAHHEIFHDSNLLLPIVDKRDVELHTDLNPAYPEFIPVHTD